MENMPSIGDSELFSQNPPAEVPGGTLDLSLLTDFTDEWPLSFTDTDRKHCPRTGSIPTFPKPEPAFLPEFESNFLPPAPQFWYNTNPQTNGQMASPYQNQQFQYSQPPTPAAECQVSSTVSPVASPYSPGSDTSFGDRDPSERSPFSGPGVELDLGDLNLKGLTEEQLVSLSARDLNRLCRDMPEDVIKQLKKRRRTLKNRGYAYNSRVRRVSQKNLLERERDDLVSQLGQIQERVKFLERELDQWKRRAQALERGEM